MFVFNFRNPKCMDLFIWSLQHRNIRHWCKTSLLKLWLTIPQYVHWILSVFLYISWFFKQKTVLNSYSQNTNYLIFEWPLTKGHLWLQQKQKNQCLHSNTLSIIIVGQVWQFSVFRLIKIQSNDQDSTYLKINVINQL